MLPIPGIGWYATCAEPGGLVFGLMQPTPDVREVSNAQRAEGDVTRKTGCGSAQLLQANTNAGVKLGQVAFDPTSLHRYWSVA